MKRGRVFNWLMMPPQDARVWLELDGRQVTSVHVSSWATHTLRLAGQEPMMEAGMSISSFQRTSTGRVHGWQAAGRSCHLQVAHTPAGGARSGWAVRQALHLGRGPRAQGQPALKWDGHSTAQPLDERYKSHSQEAGETDLCSPTSHIPAPVVCGGTGRDSLGPYLYQGSRGSTTRRCWANWRLGVCGSQIAIAHQETSLGECSTTVGAARRTEPATHVSKRFAWRSQSSLRSRLTSPYFL